MGIYNEQGASLEEPQIHHMLIKQKKDGIFHQHHGSGGQFRKPALKDVFNQMFMVGGWTPNDPSCLVEQFSPEYNEWTTAARMVHSRGSVAVGTLDGKIYTVGGEDAIRCYSSVER